MDFDDLVIGSGLGALGAVLGALDVPGRRVGVLCGPGSNRFSWYDERHTLPCAFLGEGGLGSHWHGVIPMGATRDFPGVDREGFTALFKRFYPSARLDARLGSPGFFVPWKPIRPAQVLKTLASDEHRGACLTLIPGAAVDVHAGHRQVTVTTHDRAWRARRVWVAAGALQTPSLLARTFGRHLVRGLLSDHAFCYVGQVRGRPAPAVERSRDGVFFPATYDPAVTALYTLRPAAFAFRQLDYGIEQRAVFGMPTGNAVAKIARRLSPGLLVEAFYNRFGLLGRTDVHSIYAQLPVADAYEATGAELPLRVRSAPMRQALDQARAVQPFADAVITRRPELHLPGIHLHHSLDLAALARAGVNTPGSPVQVVDASALTDIGPDHHSFKMMLSAHHRARAAID